jgi:hypothetical protein
MAIDVHALVQDTHDLDADVETTIKMRCDPARYR